MLNIKIRESKSNWKYVKPLIFLLCFLFSLPNSVKACHNSTINSVTSVNNGNGTTTYTINVSIDVGGSDGYSYGFALIFNGGCPAPIVQSGFTPTVTRPSYDPLTGYTGAAIGTGGATGYFSLRYPNQTNVLTYESDDAMWGFGSTDYNNNNIVVTVAGCVSSISLDADVRSMTTTNVPNSACVKTFNTGSTCSSGGAPTTGFSYSTPVCANAANPSPTTVAGFTSGGTYSSATGLSINASTGTINLAASTPATYTVTYSVAASGCTTAGSSTASIVITPTTTPTTGFSYTSPVCLNAGTNPTPTTVAGFTNGGTYSSTAGLTINAATGAITLGTSSAGTYTVTYSVAASGCRVAGTNTTTITLTDAGTPTTGFSYSTPVCTNATNPSPTTAAGFTTGGTYSSTGGLSINASTGVINLAASTPATYTVNYSVAASGCSTAGGSTASILITPTTNPTTGFSYTSPVCLNAGTNPTPTTVVGFTTGGNYSSTAGLTINSATGAITLGSSSAGTYTVTYSVAASGCSVAGTNTASITLTAGGTPTTGFSYSTPVCANATNPSPITVAGFTTSGTYSSAAGLSINASTGVINLAASTPATYTVNYSIAASGCSTAGSSTASIVITPTTTPTTGFSYTSPACLNAGTNPTPTTVAGFTNGGTYSSTAGLTINATTGAINLGSSSAGTYTVTYSVAASGCRVAGTNTTSITLTNGGTPTTGFSYTTPVCANAANPSPTAVAGFTTGGTYSSTAGLSINTSTGAINLTTSTPATYTVTYSVVASGCSTAGSSTASIVITPTTTPTTGFSYTSPVCLNAGTNPTPTNVIGFTTGGTYSSTAGLTINASTGLITLGTSSAGTYTVTYSVAASGCQLAATNTTSITLSNGIAPTTGFSYSTPVCANATNPSPTTVAGFTAGGTYTSTAGLSINTSTGAINLATSTPATYTITYSVVASGCSTAGSSTASIVITPTTTPITGFSYTSPVCLNAGNNPTPTTVAGFATGGTYSSTAGLTINATTGNITLGSSSAGAYTVTYSVAASGCQVAATNTTSITLSNGGTPTTSFSYPPTICTNAASTLPTNATGFVIGGTYTSTPAGLSINANSGVITPTTSAPSTYTITYSVNAAGCTAAGTSTASVTINTIPNTPIINSIDSVCVGSNNSVSILNPIQGLTYNWNLIGGNIINGIGTSSINTTWTGSGLGTISVSASNNCGTSAVSTKNVIIVNATINPPNVISICQGQSANINVSGNAVAYVWSPTQGLNNPNITNPVASPTVTTQYTVSTIGTCAITDTILINVLNIPTPSFTIQSQDSYVNSQINFINTTGQNSYEYEWNLNNGLGINNEYNTSYIYQDTGDYTITLTAINILGCKDSTKQILHIKEEPTLYIPNTFTPNGDNYNGIFQPQFVGYTRIDGYIYNKWGEKIFQWNELNGGWDGTIQGKPAQEDTYIYMIKMYNETNEINPVFEKSGHINLVR